MKKTLITFILFLGIIISAQIKFEKGYFVTNDGTTHEVLIKNIDWLNSPIDFTYKESENSAEKIAKISDVKEFQVYGYKKLVRYKGKIDNSSKYVSNFSSQKEPEWKDVEVFIYELTSENKKLYSYYGDNNYNFLYSDANNQIQPLIYKEYTLDGDNGKILVNDDYKMQLSKVFANDPKAVEMLENVEYSQKSLAKLFTENEINTSSVLKKKNKQFNLYLKPGINFAKFNLNAIQTSISKTNAHFEIEAEYLLPFNKNKWAILLSPSYNGIKGSTTSGTTNVSIDYSSIEIPLSLRYYFYLSEKSKIFLNIGFSTYVGYITNDIVLSNANDSLIYNIIHNKSNFVYGIGYNYANKFSLELKNSITNFRDYNTDDQYSYVALVFGYNIF